MKKMIDALHVFTFLAATLAIIGVVYEGFALKWFPVVGVLILIMDFLFMLSTAVNLVFYRKDKVLLGFSVFSLALILTAFLMKGMQIDFPIFGLVFWYFYVWFYYGFLIVRQYIGNRFKSPREK